VDVLALVGLDINFVADVAGVAAWLAGEPNCILDGIDLSEYLLEEEEVAQGNPDWAIDYALSNSPRSARSAGPTPPTATVVVVVLRGSMAVHRNETPCRTAATADDPRSSAVAEQCPLPTVTESDGRLS